MLKGIICALSANLLFGLVYYFALLLRPMNGETMFGYRIIVVIPFILLAIFLFKQHHQFRQLWQKIRENPPLVLLIFLLSANTGIQLWLFLWAPNNGQAIAVSLGYLLLPIVSVGLGKWVFKEHLSRLKKIALAFAMIGVGSNIVLSGNISWATFVAGLGYPIYITLRRYFQINSLATFFVELILLLPVALYYVYKADMVFIQNQNPNIYWVLLLLSIVSGSAFMLYIFSTNLLPINLSGLLGYVEPLVMLVIAFIVGETLDSQSLMLMLCLSVALLLLGIDGFQKKRKR